MEHLLHTEIWRSRAEDLERRLSTATEQHRVAADQCRANVALLQRQLNDPRRGLEEWRNLAKETRASIPAPCESTWRPRAFEAHDEELARRDPDCLQEPAADGGEAVAVDATIRGKSVRLAFRRWMPGCTAEIWGELWRTLGAEASDEDWQRALDAFFGGKMLHVVS